MKQTFRHRGLTFRHLDPIGLEVYDPVQLRWFDTDFMSRASLEASHLPDIGLWGRHNTRHYHGSLQFPQPHEVNHAS